MMNEKNWSRSVTFKLISVGVLILILLYPAYRIESLITERNAHLENAKDEVGRLWGSAQTVSGPILSVPYWHYYKKDEETVRTRRYATFLSEQMSVSGEIEPQTLYRGIYEIIVYSTQLSVEGKMRKPDISKLGISEKEVIWEEAELQLSISDLRGINENVNIFWGDHEYTFNAGIDAGEVFSSGLHLPLIWQDSVNEIDYQFQISLNGSGELSFVPLAGQTNVKLTSTWTAPSFIGEHVPSDRQVNEAGFTAEWGILSLNTSIPRQWKNRRYDLKEAAFGVELFQPVNLYQKTNRSAKYAILIIFLTFLTFFILENLSEKLVHPIQYGMIGLGLIIFYTLLLSLSEYIQFHWAYLIASGMIVMIIGGYCTSIFNSIVRGGLVSVFVALLYLFIYVIIQSEDYSLLIGSFGLYIVLACAMFFTRKINWYKYKQNIATTEAS